MRFYNPGVPAADPPRHVVHEKIPTRPVIGGVPHVRIPQAIVGYDAKGDPHPPKYLPCPEGAACVVVPGGEAAGGNFDVVPKGEWYTPPHGVSAQAIKEACPSLLSEEEYAATTQAPQPEPKSADAKASKPSK